MIYTIGHSTLKIEQFARMAKTFDVEVIWDVRSHPTSKWPWFVGKAMSRSLPKLGLDYYLQLGLGGWTEQHLAYAKAMASVGVDVNVYAQGKFPRQRIAADKAAGGPAWTNQGLYDYSWYTITAEFLMAADQLMLDGVNRNIAIMCAEAMWWKCHRSMIADYLWFRGIRAYHIMGSRLTDHSKVIGDRLQRYDPRIIDAWEAHKLRTTQRT